MTCRFAELAFLEPADVWNPRCNWVRVALGTKKSCRVPLKGTLLRTRFCVVDGINSGRKVLVLTGDVIDRTVVLPTEVAQTKIYMATLDLILFRTT